MLYIRKVYRCTCKCETSNPQCRWSMSDRARETLLLCRFTRKCESNLSKQDAKMKAVRSVLAWSLETRIGCPQVSSRGENIEFMFIHAVKEKNPERTSTGTFLENEPRKNQSQKKCVSNEKNSQERISMNECRKSNRKKMNQNGFHASQRMNRKRIIP